MSTPIRLARITVFPIKSLDGVEVDAIGITERGGLEHDRRFAMRDARGAFVNGKRTAAVHRIRTEYDLARGTATMWTTDDDTRHTFDLASDRARLGAWLSARTGVALELDEDRAGGFPDDLERPGPTLVSSASYERVHSWFPDLDGPSLRRRFRANLEVAGTPAFWEDTLIPAKEHDGSPFLIGAAAFEGANPCQRCVVPTREPRSGEVDPRGFTKEFARRRASSLPAGAPRDRFDHFWRFTLNTRPGADAAGMRIRVGDAVVVGSR